MSGLSARQGQMSEEQKQEAKRDDMETGTEKQVLKGSGQWLKILAGVLALVLLIVGAYFAYDRLSGKYEGPGLGSGTAGSGTGNAGNTGSGKESLGSIRDYDFTVQDASGKNVKLSDFIGKPIVLNFWASWCPPCKSEMPHFNKLYKEIGSEIQFMMVDMVDGQTETLSKGRKFISDSGYTFPVFYDTSGEAAYVYSVSSIPMTLFIGAEGNIVTGKVGAVSESTLREEIKAIKR